MHLWRKWNLSELFRTFLFSVHSNVSRRNPFRINPVPWYIFNVRLSFYVTELEKWTFGCKRWKHEKIKSSFSKQNKCTFAITRAMFEFDERPIREWTLISSSENSCDRTFSPLFWRHFRCQVLNERHEVSYDHCSLLVNGEIRSVIFERAGEILPFNVRTVKTRLEMIKNSKKEQFFPFFAPDASFADAWGKQRKRSFENKRWR